MTALITSAFFLGALGSTHCIGMCGPIALSLPSINNSPSSKFISSLLYNTGRVITYTVIGFIVGLLGKSFFIMGLKNVVSVFLGITVLFFFLFPYFKKRFEKAALLNNFYKNIRKKIMILFNKKNNAAVLIIGLLNGLLPCGLIYIATIGAASTNSPLESMLFMAAFGIGTIPLVWAFSFFGQLIRHKLKNVFKYTYPAIVITMACLLILRGLGVNNIMGSNKNQNITHSVIMECHK